MIDEQTVNQKSRRIRSPAYPFISLEKALERAKKIMEIEGRNVAPLSSVLTAWGYGEKSSNGRQTIAALRQFGLMEYEKGNNNGVYLTRHAWNILKDLRPDSAEKKELIQVSAKEPKIHRELWEKYGAELPSDNTILTYLIKDKMFNDSSAKGLLNVYKATISFAGLDQTDNLPSDVSHRSDEISPSGKEGEEEKDDPKEPDDKVDILTPHQEETGSIKMERLIDDEGREIIFQFSGNPLSAYHYLKDYLEFKIKRMEKRGPE